METIQYYSGPTDIKGMYAIYYEPHIDKRGSFEELYNIKNNYQYFENGISQVSVSVSQMNVIRGLHFQIDKPMAKMIRVINGYIYLFAIDINPFSPTFKNKFISKVSETYNTAYVFPPHCAIGYLIREPTTIIQYFQNTSYNKDSSFAINIFDPELNLIIYDTKYILSDRDKNAMSLKEWIKYQHQHNLEWQV